LEERWQAGCRNAAVRWRDLRDRGFPGQYTVVRDWGTQRRRQDPPAEPRGASRKPTPVALPETPTPRKAVRPSDLDRLADALRRFIETPPAPAAHPMVRELRRMEPSAPVASRKELRRRLLSWWGRFR